MQVVRAVAADRDDEALRAELGAGARWVAQLAPELRERLDLPEAGDLESEQARFALFDAVTVFLRNAAGREPLVVLLDDLHTADLPSLLLLAFLARALSETRCWSSPPITRRGRGAAPRSRPSSASSRASGCASTWAASRTTTCARWSSTAAAPTPPRSSCTRCTR